MASLETFESANSAGLRSAVLPVLLSHLMATGNDDVTSSTATADDGGEVAAPTVTFSSEAAKIARQLLTSDIVSGGGEHKNRIRCVVFPLFRWLSSNLPLPSSCGAESCSDCC